MFQYLTAAHIAWDNPTTQYCVECCNFSVMTYRIKNDLYQRYGHRHRGLLDTERQCGQQRNLYPYEPLTEFVLNVYIFDIIP